MRKSDYIGRWGGDEFLIICPETSLENSLILANDLRLSIEKIMKYPNINKGSASFGVLEVSPQSLSVDSLIFNVDKLLYKAKTGGKNKVVCL